MTASIRTALALATLLALPAWAADDSRPGFLKGPIISNTYDGVTSGSSPSLLDGGPPLPPQPAQAMDTRVRRTKRFMGG